MIDEPREAPIKTSSRVLVPSSSPEDRGTRLRRLFLPDAAAQPATASEAVLLAAGATIPVVLIMVTTGATA